MNPRILFLTAYYAPFQGGVETHARSLARYLQHHNFPTIVLTRRVDRQTPREEQIDGVRVIRVPPAGPRTGIRKWAMMPFAVAKMLSLRDQFDLIYCPGYQGIGIAGIVAAAWLRRPIVLRSANLGVLSGRNWDAPLARWHISGDGALVRWLKRRVQAIYLRADAFVCNCQEIVNEALANRVPAAHVHNLPNAVDIDVFRPPSQEERARIRAEQGWPDGTLVCLYVGRLSAEKGVMELLSAWKEIRGSARRLVLIGPDMTGHSMDVGHRARGYVAAHGLESEISFHGSSKDVARLLQGADLYVQPSHYEAFSNSLIEAMATGLPSVASAVGGMLECVTDGENGLLSRPGDADDLRRQLERVLTDPALRARLGARARETVVSQFSESVVFRKFADLFAAIPLRGFRGASVRASGETTA